MATTTAITRRFMSCNSPGRPARGAVRLDRKVRLVTVFCAVAGGQPVSWMTVAPREVPVPMVPPAGIRPWVKKPDRHVFGLLQGAFPVIQEAAEMLGKR